MRAIMRGEPVIFGRNVVDTCSKKTRGADGKLSRVSLKISQWTAVMQAGLSQYPLVSLWQAPPQTARVHVFICSCPSPQTLWQSVDTTTF